MNDEAELLDYIERLEKALESETFGGNQYYRYSSTFKKVRQRLSSEYPFAMSLSEQYDDAAQWERYADNAQGVCISMNTRQLCLLFCKHPFFIDKVYYTYDIKKNEHYKLLVDYIQTGKVDGGFRSVDSLIDNILASASRYKHHSFISEGEYRITSMGGIDQNLYKNEYFNITHELQKGQIKRVLKIRFDKLCEYEGIEYQSLFNRITIGPRSKQSSHDLISFCQETGFEDLANNVIKSKCPLR